MIKKIMEGIPEYSFAISPPDDSVRKIARIKHKLQNVAGNYSSMNSDAHLTLNMFDADEKTLNRVENYLAAFVANWQQMPLCFDRFGTPHGNAFVIIPNESSQPVLKKLMKSFRQGFPQCTRTHSENPHISVGRNMNPEQLEIAYKTFTKIHIEFVCDHLVLRKFDPQRGQYFIYKRFKFSGRDLFSELEGD